MKADAQEIQEVKRKGEKIFSRIRDCGLSRTSLATALDIDPALLRYRVCHVKRDSLSEIAVELRKRAAELESIALELDSLAA